MKSSVAVMFLVVLFATMYLSAEGTSPKRCDQCVPENCTKLDCSCGSYMDECNCCSRCFKCSGEDCWIIQNDQCEKNLKCQHPEDANQIEIMNTSGTCA